MNQIVEERMLIRVQVGKRSTIWGLLVHPERTMRHQRLAIHQEGARVWERAPQTIEHSKTMGVDIAPVVDMRSRHPRSGLQKIDAVTQAENDDGFRKVGKREAVDLVFRDEDMACRNVQRGKIACGNCDVAQTGDRDTPVEHPEP